MKHLLLLLAVVSISLASSSCIQPKTPQEEAIQEADTLDLSRLPVNSSGYTSYDYYLHWRELAKILYEDQDSSSLAIYGEMVHLIEQMKRDELELEAEEVFVSLANAFRGLQSAHAKSRIDSLLVSEGYDPFYSSKQPNP